MMILGNCGWCALHRSLSACVPSNRNSCEKEQSRENALSDIQKERAQHKSNHADGDDPSGPGWKQAAPSNDIPHQYSTGHEQKQSNQCCAKEGAVINLIVNIEHILLSRDK